MTETKIGIIGGSGLYQYDGFEIENEVDVETPFGSASDHFFIGKLNGVGVAFLPRHGRHHSLLPTEVPYRANVYGMKRLGVEYLVGVGAVGSLQQQHKPGNVVLPDQFFDRTKGGTPDTFFGEGIIAHVAFSHPCDQRMMEALRLSGMELGYNICKGGTYVNIEGPAFSTQAESVAYHKAGYDVIGMTNMIEAKLAREAEIAYASAAMVTDSDAWNPRQQPVTVDMVMEILKRNKDTAQKILFAAVPRLADLGPSPAHNALQGSIVTPASQWPEATAEKLDAIIRKYAE
ncbi:MAG: S-methyl-5'-thioadenosine phosphorylase [Verrucomicrobiota bacterium]